MIRVLSAGPFAAGGDLYRQMILKPKWRVSYTIAFWCGVTVCSAFVFRSFVDLKPKVEENFFFSSDDPQFQADKSITKLFPQPPQIILSAKGDLLTEGYNKNISVLTAKLLALPEVVEVQSVTRGPKDAAHALESPFWARALISDDKKASFVSVLIKDVSIEKAVTGIEKIKSELGRPGSFELQISGAPYIVEIIRRSLTRDFKIFSIVAFLVFAAAIFMLFRSLAILIGTLLSCLNVSMLTLSLASLFDIRIGPLTSNLAVIVFVLCLSHIIFITFNWKYALETADKEGSVSEALKHTLHPSFWSMVTEVLGFMSLLFVKATPLRQLGISGIIGTLLAFGAAYLIFPAFLRLDTLRYKKGAAASKPAKKLPFFEADHRWAVWILLILTGVAALGIPKLNTDPSLFSYFRKGGELRTGLEYIDKNGGSTPLKLVVQDAGGARLDTDSAYDKLWRMHLALEQDPSVGSVLSLPIVMAEAKKNFIGNLLPNGWLLKLLENPAFGRVTDYFVTRDRTNTLLMLRMKEQGRKEKRIVIVKRVEEIVNRSGFKPLFTGGVYLLQGKLSELVVESILLGLILLVLIFTVIGGILARSVRVGWAVFISLCMIPLGTIGILGYFRVPFDVISSPGANIAIGMGVDSMLNLLFFVKRHLKNGADARKVWSMACSRLWRPIVYATVLTCVGFGIFMLSAFPPTQRFGLSVILGMLISPVAALFVFPRIAARR